MPDTKLSGLTAGSLPDFYYGEKALTSLKYAGTGFFNVKDSYGGLPGAVGNNSNDDTAAIQRAINAAIANHGGTVFFPSGSYVVTSALTVPAGSNYGIVLKGSGSAGSGETIFDMGTRITGSFQDYLIRTLHLGIGVSPGDESPIGLIEDIGFNNSFNLGANVTSTQAPGDIVTGNGHGCIYMTTEAKFIIRNCTFTIVTGIALFCTAQSTRIVDCSFQGTYGFTNAGRSIGVFILNGIITGGAITGLGIAMMQANAGGSGYFGVENIDCEGNGSICVIGHSTIAYWAIDSSIVLPAGVSGCDGGFIRKLQGESNATTDGSGLNSLIYIGSATNLIVESVRFANISNRAAYGLNLHGLANCTFRSMNINGSSNAFDVAGVAFNGKVQGCRFIEITSIAGSGATGVNWLSPLYSTSFNVGENGNYFEYCNTTGAATLDTGAGIFFPVLPNSPGQTHWISDCRDPAWTGTVSNVGKPVSAGMVTSSGTASGNTLHFTAGSIPSQIAADGTWRVCDPGEGAIPSTTLVSGVNNGAGTITLDHSVFFAVAAAQPIAFVRGGGTNLTQIKWTGDYTQNTGAWCIAG